MCSEFACSQLWTATQCDGYRWLAADRCLGRWASNCCDSDSLAAESYGDSVSWDTTLGIAVPSAVTLIATALGFRLALRQEHVRFAREQRTGLYIDLLTSVRLDVQMVWQEVHDPRRTESVSRPVLTDAEHTLRARVDLYGSTPVRDMYDKFISWRVRDHRDLQERDHHLTEMAALAGQIRELLRVEVGIEPRGRLTGSRLRPRP